ncbi:phosphatase PAP2 family protein [Vibrio sp. RC27]
MPFIKHLVQPIVRDRYIYFTGLIILCCYSIYHHIYIRDQAYDLWLYLKAIMNAIGVTAAVGFCGYFFYLIGKRDPHPLKAYGKLVALPFVYWREAINFALLALMISIVFSVYTNTKYSIPAVVPYYLDTWLANADQWLHFGHTPWVLTHSWFSHPIATSIINLMYNLWFFIFSIFFISFMLLVNKPGLRQQVIISFCLAWVINGNIGGLLFSSVGPCYYGHFFPDTDLFFQLMERLHQQNDWLKTISYLPDVWALDTQDLLWESYQSNTNSMGAGISAAPSMHVTIASLMAMSLFNINRKLGVLAWVYAGIIEIGSVHLAWHYAIDGYLGLIFMTIIWWSVKAILARLPSPAMTQQTKMRAHVA